jgi:hypothetical protein
MAIDTHLLAAARRLRAPTPEWHDRVVSHDYRASVLQSLEGEVLFASGAFLPRSGSAPRESVLGDLLLDHPVPGGYAEATLEAPYSRLCLAGYSETMRRAILMLRESDPCVALPTPDNGPRWNLLARQEVPQLTHSYATASRLSLDQELTGAILFARAEPEVALARSPLPSAVCPGLAFQISRASAGTVAIAPTRTLPCPHPGEWMCTPAITVSLSSSTGTH